MKSIRGALLLIWLPYALAGGQDPSEVLTQVVAKVRARDAGMPNYTCVQTVQREYYKPRGSTLPRSCQTLMNREHRPFDLVLDWILTDRLRLDVTMSQRGEIYSWVGDSHFEDATIDQLVRSGPIGTGSFGGFLSVVFDKDVKSFRFEREIVVNGRSLMEYSFQVPIEKSSYQVKADNSWIRTAYSGTIQVDPETKELLSMSVNSAELPLATGSCSSSTSMEFGLARIGDGEFLLPQQGRQRFIAIAGEEAENTTTFSNCREYRGESTVNFSPPPEVSTSQGGKGKPAKPVRFLTGMPFTFELTESIATDRAAAGDAFTGRLVTDLPGAPNHARVDGRVLRVQIERTASRRAVLVLKLRTVEVRGVKVPIEAVRDWARMPRTNEGRVEILLPLPWEQNAGVFLLQGDHASLEPGFRSRWVTK